MTTFSFGPGESAVRDPFYALSLHPDAPFSLNDEHTPWGAWACDRFMAFYDLATFRDEANDDETAAFIRMPTPSNATALAQMLQGSHSFDGSLAFIPASHAEDFYAHLQRFVMDALVGANNQDEAAIEELHLGSENSDPVAYWGSSVPDGLLLLFATSCDAYDEDWLASAFQRYPKRDEITAPEGATSFDPDFAFFHQDCHLGDHIYVSRHEDNPVFGSFLAWASDKGYLRVNHEMDE